MSPRPLVQSGTDPEQVRRAERKVAQAEDLLLASLRAVLATPSGRYVFWHLLEEDAHINATSFDLSGSAMYFKEGKRVIGVAWRTRMLAADEALYDLMTREARQRTLRLDTETAAAHEPPAEE